MLFECSLPQSSSVTFDQWIQIINTVGTWVAGLATTAAVAFSLWLSSKNERIDLAISANPMISFIQGQGLDRHFIGFRVVNRGERHVNVTSIGWEIGRGKNKRYAIQKFDRLLGDDIPARLEHGQAILCCFDHTGGWHKYFAKGFVQDKKNLKTLRIYADSSVGQRILAKPSTVLLEQLENTFSNMEND